MKKVPEPNFEPIPVPLTRVGGNVSIRLQILNYYSWNYFILPFLKLCSI